MCVFFLWLLPPSHMFPFVELCMEAGKLPANYSRRSQTEWRSRFFFFFFTNNNKKISIISSSVVSSSLPDFQTLWTETTGRSTSRRLTWPSVWWRRATTPRGSPSRMSLRSQVRVAAARRPPDCCLLSFDLSHSKKNPVLLLQKKTSYRALF